jgi:hypothetical protein
MINDLTTIDTIDINSLDDDALMALTGQGTAPSSSNSGNALPRLTINYDAENDEGQQLPRGYWKLMLDGQFVYADTLSFRPFARMYTYSLWDPEENRFISQSIQSQSLGDRFPDSAGTERCGRLLKDEAQQLDESDPRLLLSNQVICNTVLYGVVSGTAKTSSGDEVTLEDQPVVAYFKKSGFRPAREAIDMITRQKKLMQKTVFDLGTQKHKMGSVTYWTPTFTQTDYLKDLSSEDMEMIKKFIESVKGYNESILNRFREATKALEDATDLSLEAELEDANAA